MDIWGIHLLIERFKLHGISYNGFPKNPLEVQELIIREGLIKLGTFAADMKQLMKTRQHITTGASVALRDLFFST